MRKFNLVFSLVFCMMTTAFSQTKLELAKEFYEVKRESDTSSSDKKLTDTMKHMYKMQIEWQIRNKDSLTMQKVDAAVEEIMKAVEKQNEEFKTAILDLYANYFTEQELKDLIQLYKSSIWKKQQEIKEKISAEEMQILSQNSLKIQELIQKKATEINNNK